MNLFIIKLCQLDPMIFCDKKYFSGHRLCAAQLLTATTLSYSNGVSTVLDLKLTRAW